MIEKINNLLAGSATIFLIDNITADETLDKCRQPLLGLAISWRHRGHSLWLLTQSYTAVPNKIITPALVVFERVVSGALKNGVINEEEFNMLQTLHLETLNELTGINRRMEAEHRSLVEKSLLEEINEIKKIKEQEFKCLLAVLFRVLP